MSVASNIFPGLETAPKNRTNADGVKIIRRHDASDGALRAIAKAECGAHDFVHDKGVDQRAALLKVKEIGPGDIGRAGLAASGSGEGEKPFLVRYKGVGTEKDSFDPTENRGVGADSQGEAKDDQDRKARAAPEHAEADADVLQYALEPQRQPNAARVFPGEHGRTHATIGGVAVAKLSLEHLAVKLHLLGQVGVLAAPAEEVKHPANQAHDRTF